MINGAWYFYNIRVPKPNGYRSTIRGTEHDNLKVAEVTSKPFGFGTSHPPSSPFWTVTHTYAISAASQRRHNWVCAIP
jgi:hypothetical protein